MQNINKNNPILIPSEADMFHFAAQVVQDINSSAIVFLKGALGAGKTTFVRGFLRTLGYSGIVKSPTYTLVETYTLPNQPVIHHFDLYRLKSPFELDHLGPDHYFTKESICLVEWPEKAKGILPKPSLILSFEIKGNKRLVYR